MKVRFTSLIICLFISACAGTKPADSPLSFTPEKRIFTDDLGRSVSVPVEIKRIVSLAPSATEMVYAVGAGERLVGVTTFCNYPEQAKGVTKIGDTMNPNMETIIALKPDIVLVSTASQIETFTKTLEQNQIAVFVTDAKDIDDVLKGLEVFGQIFGTENIARPLITNLGDRSSMCFIRTQEPKRVFVQISREPLFTVGKGAFVTDLIRNVGGISVTADIESAYPKLSKETALALNPDVIILSDSEDNREPNDVFKNSPAVKNGRVLKVNADILSRPGPRLVDAMEQIVRFLDPARSK